MRGLLVDRSTWFRKMSGIYTLNLSEPMQNENDRRILNLTIYPVTRLSFVPIKASSRVDIYAQDRYVRRN
jgi:hypothetical protein